MLLPVAKFLPDGPQPADREVLRAHADWECKAHNELLHFEHTAKPEFPEIGRRTWCHWTYDLTALAEKLRQDPKNTDHSPGPKTQQLLTTVIGKNLLVLVCTTMIGQEEADTEKSLMNAAKSLVIHPKPLSPEQIKELC